MRATLCTLFAHVHTGLSRIEYSLWFELASKGLLRVFYCQFQTAQNLEIENISVAQNQFFPEPVARIKIGADNREQVLWTLFESTPGYLATQPDEFLFSRHLQ